MARDKLKELRQRGKVSEYISAFDNIVVSLPETHEADLLHSFVYGLK